MYKNLIINLCDEFHKIHPELNMYVKVPFNRSRSIEIYILDIDCRWNGGINIRFDNFTYYEDFPLFENSKLLREFFEKHGAIKGEDCPV